MTSALLTDLLCCLAVLSGLLLLGTFLRAKVKLFQQLFLPASVIGGFIGLLFGPIVMGDHAIIRVSQDWINTWSLLPGILIVPVFASVPLGMFMNSSGKTTGMGGKTAPNVLKAFGLFAAIGALQNMIGYGTNLFFTYFGGGKYQLYRTFGYELSAGYTGGHGTAGAVGKILEGLGIEYWATAQGIAVTTATVGIIGGMIIGIIAINMAAKQGKTSILKKPGDIPTSMAKGYTTDISKQGSMGRETFMNSSIETTTFHLALMLGGCGLAYAALNLLKRTGIAAFASLPVWIYAMVIMFGINALLIKLKLNWMIDTKVKAKITGAMSDFAIVAAIASLPVKAVLAYAVPLIVMMAVGMVATYVFVFKMHDVFFKGDYSFERAIICWGTATGVMITGMMLLKICDPDYDTPALADFSMGFSLISLSGLITQPITLGVLATGSTMSNFTLAAILFLIYMVITSAAGGLSKMFSRKAEPALAGDTPSSGSSGN